MRKVPTGHKIDVLELTTENVFSILDIYCLEHSKPIYENSKLHVINELDGQVVRRSVSKSINDDYQLVFTINKPYHGGAYVTYHDGEVVEQSTILSEPTIKQFMNTHALHDPKMPLQPINNYRFVSNRIVEALLETSTLDMNDIAMMDFTRNEQEQFAQLIGYSVSGFGDLSYSHPDTVAEADLIADGVDNADVKDLIIAELREELNTIKKGVAKVFENDMALYDENF